jgi:hypothetical protein
MRGRIYLALGIAVALVAVAPGLYAQDQEAIQKKLSSQFALTTMTADKSDVAKTGSVLVLHKDGLMFCGTNAVAPPTSTYKNGAVSFGTGAQMAWGMSLGLANQQAIAIAQRKFVNGEKFWVTAYEVHADGVILLFYSDPFGDTRYYGKLKFPFQKGKFPAADDMMKTIAEVITVDTPQEGAASDAPAPGGAAEPAAAPAAAENVPQAAPKTIALGQTKDEVVGIFGQPQKIANLGAKEIYYYPDMKVTFVNGKVSNVE